jgi:UDP-hydrolysing UDP-N-acetyl-D-glucosamine 2-epimerase
LRPLIAAIRAEPALEPALIVGGMHLAPEFGLTVHEIEADDLPIAARVEAASEADTPAGMAGALGSGALGFAAAYERIQPDILVVFGDRLEMFAAAAAAVPFAFPIAHVSGGALSEGAIDDALRHAITKLSHLHFVDCAAARRRVLQMGEAEGGVFEVGALGLDAIRETPLLSLAEVGARFGLDLAEASLLVTFHPVTREYGNTGAYMVALLAALAESGFPAVFTYPSADTGATTIIRMIEAFARERAGTYVVPHLGSQGYLSLMGHAAAMVGNSSSGIIEAATFELPVIDIGTRQKGRMAPRNVIHCGYEMEDIRGAVERATSPAFRESLAGLVNPYGDGHAAGRIVEVLKGVELGEALLAKGFVDRPG